MDTPTKPIIPLGIEVDIRTGGRHWTAADLAEDDGDGDTLQTTGETETITELPDLEMFGYIKLDDGTWCTNDDVSVTVETDHDDMRYHWVVTEDEDDGGKTERWYEVTRTDCDDFPADNETWPPEPETEHTFSFTVKIVVAEVGDSQTKAMLLELKTAMWDGLRQACRDGRIPKSYYAMATSQFVTEDN